MAKILKMDAFEAVVESINNDKYEIANAIMGIISRSQEQDRRNNIFSDYIELNNKNEEMYFKVDKILRN